MNIPDSALEKIAEYFKLTPYGTDGFIEFVRGAQAEIFWKSTLMYFEEFKTPAEVKYLQLLSEKLASGSQEAEQKLYQLIGNEFTVNPEATEYVMQRIMDFVWGLIRDFAAVAPLEDSKAVMRELLPNLDLLSSALRSGQIQSTGKITLLAKNDTLPAGSAPVLPV